LLGQVQETIEAPAAARTAYRRVRQFDPAYNLGLAARLSDIELQGTHEDAEAALDRLEDLESDDKNYDNRGEMALVRARIYRAQGQYDEARRTLQGMLYGEEAPSGSVEGRLHYDLASLYRDAYKDFSRAAAHFDTASTGLQSGGLQSGTADAQRLPKAPVDATEQASRYRDLAEGAREVARMDSLLRIGRMSDQEFRAFVEELRRKRQKAQAARQEERQQVAGRQRFRQRGQAMGEQRRTTASAADTRQSDAGFLFHQDPSRIQQGRQRFQETWGDRPRVDNWRRRNAIRASTSSQADSASEEQEGASASARAPTAQAASPEGGESSLDLSGIPRDSSSQAKMEAERAVARYELANSLFLAAGRPDSAATWYRRILQQNGDHPVAQRALYALAEAYRAQGDTTAAQQAYLRLIDQHPDTRLAERARERLDRATTDPTETVAARADSAYARAYRRWQMGEWRPALDSLLSIAGRHPDTDAAPRALLASGIIYWQRTQIDSIGAPRVLVDRHLQALSRRRAASSSDSSSANQTVSGDTEAPPDSVRSTQDSLTTTGARDESRAEATDSTPARDSVRSQQGRTPSPDSVQTVVANPPRQAGADTGRVQDSVRTEAQQRAPSTDSLQQAAANSLQSVPDSARGGSESLASTVSGGGPDAVGKSVYTPLKTLLDHLTEQYSDAPQVERARILLSMIEEQQAPKDSATTDTTAADTTGRNVPSADSAATNQTAPAATEAEADSVRGASVPRPQTDSAGTVGQAADSTNAPAASEDRDPLPAPTDPAATRPEDRGQASPSSEWALLVDRFASSEEAAARLNVLRRQLGGEWDAEVIQPPSTEEQRFFLLVGRFSTEKAAVAARNQLQERISGTLEAYRRPSGQGPK
jgi:tetratricopeptide (TPR) repeat protein